MKVEQPGWIKGVGSKMIKTVIRMKNDLVMVFDDRGEQKPDYQGKYDEVRESVVRDATPDAVFLHWSGNDAIPETVSREEW
jgi:hypothetical protein